MKAKKGRRRRLASCAKKVGEGGGEGLLEIPQANLNEPSKQNA